MAAYSTAAPRSVIFQVVGVADLPDSSRHAILWESDGTVRDLGVLRSAQHFDLTERVANSKRDPAPRL